MKIYVCGGAVRDILLGFEPKDLDYVVCGSSHEEMEALDFKKVGASFPVYLKGGEEYALARQERKTGVGYNGFEVVYDSSVSLEDDLKRRDLTINSMAVPLEWWNDFVKTKSTVLVVDPFGGLLDIESKVLRHTSEAFSDDPVRVLRLSRFATRYNTFTVDPKTIDLAKHIVPELAHVPSERLWTEIYKGLQEKNFVKMFDVFREIGAFDIPALNPLSVYNLRLPNNTDNLTTIQKFALISDGFRTPLDFSNLSVPVEFSRFSKIFNSSVHSAAAFMTLQPDEMLNAMTKMRIFNEYLTTTKTLVEIYNLYNWQSWNDSVFLQLVKQVLAVDTISISSKYTNGKQIATAIQQARIEALSLLVL